MKYVIKSQEEKEKTVGVSLEKVKDGTISLCVGNYYVFDLYPDGTARLVQSISESNLEGIQIENGHIKLRD